MMSVSIYDIAKKARVAPSTVSRALEDHPRIGAETKQRIQELDHDTYHRYWGDWHGLDGRSA
jgi:hypothetical protein